MPRMPRKPSGSGYYHVVSRGIGKQVLFEETEDYERYLLTAVRYIHNNPPKAGICPRDEYRWSSWREYMGAPDLVATELVLELVGGVERFVPFSEGDVREPFLDATEKRRLTDSQAIDLIRAELHLKSGTQVQSMSKAERDEALRVMKERGISVRQIERLTGINRGAIQRA